MHQVVIIACLPLVFSPRGGRGGFGGGHGRGRGGRGGRGAKTAPPSKEDLDAQLDAYNARVSDAIMAVEDLDKILVLKHEMFVFSVQNTHFKIVLVYCRWKQIE